MTTNIITKPVLSKFGGLVFTRQSPNVAAQRHQSLRAGFKAWLERHAAQRELENLSDRSLNDIGLARQDIKAAVRAKRAGR